MKLEKKDRSHYLFSNKALVTLIIPLMIEQLLSILVGMVDSIMVASVGEAAVSAVSLVDTIFILMINIFAAMATGGAVIAGQYLGSKNPKQACKAVNQLAVFIALAGVVITILIYLLHSVILHGVFGQIEPDVMMNAKKYLLITTASIPFIALYNAGAAVFRAMGNSRTPMKMSMIMNAINIAGNALLIFGFHFGVEGVAIPTLVSRMFAGVGMMILLRNQNHVLHLPRPFSFRLEWDMLKKILHLGLPNSLEDSMFQLGKILVLSLISTYGTASITANAISNNVCNLQVLPGFAMSYAMTAVIAQCVGAGDYDQVRYYAKKLLFITYVAIFISIGAIFIFYQPILNIYDVSAEAEAYARKIIIWHGLMSIFFWPSSFTFPNALRAANDVTFCMTFSILNVYVMRLSCCYLLGTVLEMGVFGVWVAMTLDWIVRTIGFTTRYRRGKWVTKKVI